MTCLIKVMALTSDSASVDQCNDTKRCQLIAAPNDRCRLWSRRSANTSFWSDLGLAAQV